MLVQKKISTKKLTIYLAIISLMISGMGFMLYQNKKLTSRKTTNVNPPIVFNDSAPAKSAAANNQTGEEKTQNFGADKAELDGGFNLNIFSSDKFKNLQANAFIIKDQPETGKRDPFKPN
ncbi:hypothetical protein HY797_03655 [Candidatus Falkowbacteria bacterium]|nr:hypothetical protein [Candidatus Falkowbacteria bacterium]